MQFKFDPTAIGEEVQQFICYEKKEIIAMVEELQSVPKEDQTVHLMIELTNNLKVCNSNVVLTPNTGYIPLRTINLLYTQAQPRQYYVFQRNDQRTWSLGIPSYVRLEDVRYNDPSDATSGVSLTSTALTSGLSVLKTNTGIDLTMNTAFGTHMTLVVNDGSDITSVVVVNAMEVPTDTTLLTSHSFYRLVTTGSLEIIKALSDHFDKMSQKVLEVIV